MSREPNDKIELEIAHVLFIDIVGYSKLSLTQQRAAIEELNEIVRLSAQFQKSEADGHLLKLATGDGMALVFTTSPQAPAQCSIELARALKSRPHLLVRMGFHSGPVNGVTDLSGNANVAGAGINIAQRVMSCGDAGHILLSKRAAEDLVEFDRWGPRLHELGPAEVKHGTRIELVNLHDDEIGNPAVPAKLRARQNKRWRLRGAVVAGLLIGIAAIVAVAVKRTRNAASMNVGLEKSIAVLPFENLSRDPDNAYFAEGIQDEILTRLSKIADLKVISRTSTQHYKSAPENLREIGKQLHVAHLVEGSVQKSGDSVRVNVQLIKAANDSHIWAETFDRKLTDLFSVESEVAKTIADQLRAKLTGKEEQIIGSKPTTNPKAYDAYLRGLAYTEKSARSSANDLAAQKYIREATRLDPNFAEAWALLGYIDAAGYITSSLQPTDALREEARAAGETALRLKPYLGECLVAKGYYYYACLKDYDTAEGYLQKARNVWPNSSRVSETLAYLYRRKGQWDRSDAFFEEAERLDPRGSGLFTQHALAYMTRRRFSDARGKLEQILAIAPEDPYAITLKAEIAQMEGDLTSAAALLGPLRPTAANTQIVETQAYQAILERRPEQMANRLNELLANADPSLGYNIGVLRFYLGWLQDIGGNKAAAEESWRKVRTELEPLLEEQPKNYLLIAALAFSDAGLGDKPAALALTQRAANIEPIGKDAITGGRPLDILARVAAVTGDTPAAVDAIEKLLSTTYGGVIARQLQLTPALLRLDPMFDSLRSDPRFEHLAHSDGK